MANLKDLIVNGSARILGTLYATVSGNASTATKLETQRAIQTNLASTSSANFDGSADITPGVTGTLAVANGGTGQTSIANIQAGKDADGNTISSTYAKSSTLATVATSGSYNDLIDKPTIPSVDSALSTTSENPVQNKVITSKMVTVDTAQDISGRKTFLGEKAIYFKQSSNTDKLGFTLYNSSNTELAALEYRPNTVDGKALLALNSKGDAAYIGFRYWGNNINYVLPQGLTQGNYYMPIKFANGASTATASSAGTVDLSGLGFLTSSSIANMQTTSNLVTSVSSSSTDSQYPSAKLFYDTCGDIEALINAL